MNKKLMIAMVVVGMSALYVRFQVVGMEEGDQVEQKRQRLEREAERAVQVPGAEASEISTGPSKKIIANNMAQMWKYEISKKLSLPPKVMAFLCRKLCIPNRRTLQSGDLVNSVAFSPDGKLLATGSSYNSTAGIWNLESGQRLQTLQHAGSVHSVAFSPDGRLLATGSWDRTAGIWDVANGQRLQTLQQSGHVSSVVFSPDGRLLAMGALDGITGIWDVASGQKLQTLQCGGWVNSVAFSHDGRLLATGSWDRTAGIWDVANGQRLQTFQCDGFVYSVAFSPDGRLLATGADGGIAGIIWDVTSGNKVRRLQHTNAVTRVTFSRDGKLLATGSYDRTAGIWDVATGQRLQTLQGGRRVYSVVFSPDGKLLATASNLAVYLWNVECFQTLERSIITTFAQYKLMQALEDTFESKADKQFGQRRPVGRIQATPQQWATFLTLPQPVQDALKLRIKDSQEAEDPRRKRDIPEHSTAAGAEESARKYLDVGHSGIG